MRLSEHQRDVIRRTTAEVAGPSARVLLFGSRTRPELRGGDIDLLIELAQPSPDRWALGTRPGAHIERQSALGAARAAVPLLTGAAEAMAARVMVVRKVVTSVEAPSTARGG